MRSGQLRRRRSRAQKFVLGVIAALVLLTSGVAAGLNAHIVAASEAGTRGHIADALPNQGTVEVTARGGDEHAEDAAVTEQVADLLGDVPYRVHRSGVVGPTTLRIGPDGQSEVPQSETGRVLFLSYEDVAAHADLVGGRWPDDHRAAGPVPVAVHATPAGELGIDVGDAVATVQRGEVVTLQVSGLYRPRDPGSAFWYGQDREIEGRADGVDLLAVVGEDGLALVSESGARTRWRVVPDLGRFQGSDIASFRLALTQLEERLGTDARLAGSQVTIDDEVSDVLRERHDKLEAVRSVVLVPLVLLGVASVIALSLAAVLLATARQAETALLRSRGASSLLLAGWTVREALAVVLVPAAAGGLVAWLVLGEVGTPGAEPSPLALVAGAAAAAVVGVAAVSAVGIRATWVPVQATTVIRAASSRRRALVRVGSVLLLVVVAGLMSWQLRRYDTPLVTGASGVARTDPLAVAAPAAVLVAGGVLAALVVAAVAGLVEEPAGRRRGLVGALAVREVARRPAGYALPVVLVVIAAGAGTLAAGFTATWSGLQADAAAQRTGADLQVVLSAGTAASVTTTAHKVDLRRYREIAGAEVVQPGVVTRATTAAGAVELLARPAATAAPTVGAQLAASARSVELGLDIAVRGSVDERRLDLEGLESADLRRPKPAPVRAQLWLADADGVVSLLAPVPVEAPADGRRSSYQMRAGLPAGPPPWTVIGVGLQVIPPRPDGFAFAPWSYQYDIDVTELRTDAGVTALGEHSGWEVSWLDSDVVVDADRLGALEGVAIGPAPTGPGLRVDSGGLPWSGQVSVRMTPGDLSSDPLPAAGTAKALDRFGLSVGDRLSLRVLGTDVPVEVVDSVAAVPGTTAADVMAVDLAQLTGTLLTTGGRVPVVNRIWVDANADALVDSSVADGVAGVAGPTARVIDKAALESVSRGDALSRVSLVTFWVASGALALLAVAGLAVSAAVTAQQRSRDVAVLRLVGVSAGQQARARQREHMFVAALAVGLGVAVGWLVTTLAAGLLVRTATPSRLENLEPVLRVAVGPLVGYLATLGLMCVLVAAVLGAGVRFQASRLLATDGAG